jgi:hypothetical protein
MRPRKNRRMSDESVATLVPDVIPGSNPGQVARRFFETLWGQLHPAIDRICN